MNPQKISNTNIDIFFLDNGNYKKYQVDCSEKLIKRLESLNWWSWWVST
jgi:hypothetical protein